ncbi:hypothetical protein ROT00_12390 [Agromyces mediolanus]|uniref:hypothetical protein n=1 Tax=Agromyces mediolanus TaxID=41986 RepID=UPI003833A38C
MEHEPTPGERPGPSGGRRRLLRWLVPVAVAALLVGIGVPLGLWAADRAAVGEQAAADAERLQVAVAAATEASARFEATAGLASEYSESTAAGVGELVAGKAAEFSADAAGSLTGAVEALAASLTPSAVQDAAPGSALDWAPGAEAAEVRAHYEAIDGPARNAARGELDAEVARLDALADEFDLADGAVREAVDGVDAAIVAVAAAGAAAGTATIAASGYATAETRAAMEQSVAGLQAIAETSLPVAWAGRAEAPPFAELASTAQGYVDAAAAVRASNTANTPAPEPEPEESWDDDGGDGTGSEYRWCYLPDPFGFTYQVPC